MKVFLSHGYFLAEDAKEQQIMRPYPPLGLLYLSAYLKKNGIQTRLFDTTFSHFGDLCFSILTENPDVVALYVNLMTKLNILKIIRFLKESPQLQHIRVVVGGPEVTYNAEKLIQAGADVVVIGEGEQTLLELIQHWEREVPDSLENIPGIVFSEVQGPIIQTAEREKLKDLNQLPMPDRDGIQIELYLEVWKKFHGKSAISISTMRGCPYTCRWCSRAVYGLSYRRRSPQLVVDEMKWIMDRYSPDSLWFVDDVFTVSHKWMKEFAQCLKISGFTIPYECISRADRLSEEIIALLKETGCFRLWIGAESGSQRIIDAMDRRVSVAQTGNMIQLAKAYGIEAGTFIMLGYPGETLKDIDDTIAHLKRSSPDWFTITLTYPIRGTELYEEVKDRLVENPAWESSTDRDLVFERNFGPRFYHYALKHVTNEVAFAKWVKKGPSFFKKAMMHKIKSTAARAMMQWNVWVN